MSSNGNGWVKWAIGLIVTLLITVLPLMSNIIWSNEKDGRTRDEVLADKLTNTYKEICGKIETSFDKQETVNDKIKVELQSNAVLLTKILTKLENMKGESR